MSDAVLAGYYDEPQNSGDLVAVNHGTYDRQEVWVRSGANIGNWYPLGGEFRVPQYPEIPPHPTWEDVLARGPVTLLTGGSRDAYQVGWRNGRRKMVHQMESIEDEEE